jgi:hypothetical protein
MSTERKNLEGMIEIMRDATCCDEWADDVTKRLNESNEAGGQVPEYIWSFFDLTSGFNFQGLEDETSKTIPWIQQQMTTERFERINERMKIFKDTKSIVVRHGTQFVKDNMFLEDNENMEKYYDAYTESTSWAVLSLFVHRTIRKVGKGEEEDNKYCYWPLSQPWVNHRPIDLSLIEGKDGYIESLSKETNHVWSVQQGFSLPYCISNDEVADDDKIDIEFMINSGESKTNADEYIQAKDSNCAAGKVHCVKLEEESLNQCVDILTVSYDLYIFVF